MQNEPNMNIILYIFIFRFHTIILETLERNQGIYKFKQSTKVYFLLSMPKIGTTSRKQLAYNSV